MSEDRLDQWRFADRIGRDVDALVTASEFAYLADKYL